MGVVELLYSGGFAGFGLGGRVVGAEAPDVDGDAAQDVLEVGFGVRDMYVCMLFSMYKDLILEVGLGLKMGIYAASLYV